MERQKKIYTIKEGSAGEPRSTKLVGSAPGKRQIVKRKNSLRQWLTRFNDEQQKNAGKNLLRFFIILLILTLVARGTAGATLPKVETVRAETGEIVQRVRGTGTVVSGASIAVEMPNGLTFRQILVTTGQAVSAGDNLAQFDEDELNDQLQRAVIKLDEMKLELQQIQRDTRHNGSELESARRTVERAQQDYNSTKSQNEENTKLARHELEQAKTAVQEALEYVNSLTDISSQEYIDAYNDWAAKSEDVPAKEEALTQAQSSSEAGLLSAARVLEDAQAVLSRAKTTDAEARQNESDESDKNSLAAETLKMDISNQQETVTQLQTLADDDGWLPAAVAGTLQEVPRLGTKSSEDTPFRLSDASSGFEVEVWVDKKDAEKLAPGDSCEVVASGGSVYYKQTYAGRITVIGASGDDGNTKVTVRLLDGNWKSGQTVEVQAVQDRQIHSNCVPLSVLHSSNDGYYILVLQQTSTILGIETVAAKIPVTVKAQDNQQAAIEGAFGERDDIISASNKAVQPGDSVRVAS